VRGVVKVNVVGRDGSVRYTEGLLRVIDGHFEIGGGSVLAIISFGSQEEWRAAQPWAVDRRAEILGFIAADLIRQQAPNCAPDIDEATGVILLRQTDGGAQKPAGPSPRERSAAFFWRFNKLRSVVALFVLAITVVVGGLVLMGREAATLNPLAGSPLDESVRYGRGVATLIMRTDPQGPRWSGRGGGETVSLSVLLIPFDGGAPRSIPLVGGVSAGSVSLARVLGDDGETVWVEAGAIYGVRLRDGAVVTAKDLRAANGALDPSWWDDGRGMAVSASQLHIVRRDRSAALDIDPQTLQAKASAPRTTPPRLSPPAQAEAMAAGFVTSDGAWLGLLTPDQRTGAYRTGRFVRPIESADEGNTDRFMTRAALEPASDRKRFRILSAAPVDDTAYLNAGFLRINASAEPLRLQNPSGVMMIHTRPPAKARLQSTSSNGASRPSAQNQELRPLSDEKPGATFSEGGLTGTLLVSRVDEKGGVIWTAETGLDRFTLGQILPGESVTAFIGARPPLPGKVSEPLVVLVAHETGAVTTHALSR